MCDSPTFCNLRVAISRKAWRCQVCFSWIAPGVRYVTVAGVWNGEMQRHGFHRGCWDAYMDAQAGLAPVDCLAWEETMEHLAEGGEFAFLPDDHPAQLAAGN